ncbi:MAG: response regulator [Candidatus Paceibacterota bacterium]|jgi:CheY-like chemotaxis protein|nr:response regulator [Candidatus Paceibacterota bacterium]
MQENKKILIVEDEEALRRILVEFLRSETAWEVFEAGDGEEALELIRKVSPDLALLDIAMPKMDGLTLAKKMMEEELTEKTKIIFLTNSAELSSISSVSSPAVMGYLVKSNIDMREVIERITEALTENS